MKKTRPSRLISWVLFYNYQIPFLAKYLHILLQYVRLAWVLIDKKDSIPPPSIEINLFRLDANQYQKTLNSNIPDWQFPLCEGANTPGAKAEEESHLSNTQIDFIDRVPKMLESSLNWPPMLMLKSFHCHSNAALSSIGQFKKWSGICSTLNTEAR